MHCTNSISIHYYVLPSASLNCVSYNIGIVKLRDWFDFISEGYINWRARIVRRFLNGNRYLASKCLFKFYRKPRRIVKGVVKISINAFASLLRPIESTQKAQLTTISFPSVLLLHYTLPTALYNVFYVVSDTVVYEMSSCPEMEILNLTVEEIPRISRHKIIKDSWFMRRL